MEKNRESSILDTGLLAGSSGVWRKKENEMEKQESRQVQRVAVSMCLLIVINLVLIFQFIGKSNTRITEQNQRYLEDDSRQSLKTLDGLFRNSVSNISMISSLYEHQMNSPEIGSKELNILQEQTTFDQVRFVDKNGLSLAKDGSVQDCSDREYYTKGIRGNSGVTFVKKSRFTSTKMLLFYAPYHDNGEIAGVLVGIYDEKRLQEMLSSTYFGSPASEYLCLRDGTVVASSRKDAPGNVLDEIEEKGIVKEHVVGELRQAFKKGKTYSFNFMDDVGVGSACMVILENSDWVLLKTFPATAGNVIRSSVNRDVIQLETMLVIVFIVFIVIFVLYYAGQNVRLRRSSESYGQIVNSVKMLYERFVVFDFENNTYDYLKAGNLEAGVAKQGDYFEWLNVFPGSHFAEEDAARFLEEFSPENLKNRLSLENHFVQYEYEVKNAVDAWEKYSLIKLDMDRDDTTRVLAAVEDVTALKKEELEKRRALEVAFRDTESANNAKMDFMSRMSHDIRTPMNAIIGLTAIAGAHMDDRERINDCLAKIRSSSNYLLSLINEVLDMSKIESGKFSLAETGFNLPGLVDEVAEIIRPDADAKKQNFTVHYGDIRHEDVIGDSLRVQQIFVNILSNAVKYTPEGGNITLSISEKENRNHLLCTYELVFEDDGIGMSKEFLERLYLPFERAEDVRISKIQGIGLGMTIVRNIVRAMDGTIKVKSAPGRGTKFTVVISLKHQETGPDTKKSLPGYQGNTAQADRKQDNAQIADLGELGLSGMRALLVEDNEINMEIAMEILGTAGLMLETSENGKAGLDMFSRSPEGWYSIIFMDIQMPVMNGYEAAAAIRALPREDAKSIPIVAMTANAFSEDVQDALSAGMNEHIAKPLDLERLRQILERYCLHKSVHQQE